MARRKYSWLVALVLLQLSQLSCNKDVELIVEVPYEQPTDMKEIIPLSSGYAWIYDAIGCGDLCNPSCCDTTLMVRIIEGQTQIDSLNAYNVVTADGRHSQHFLEYTTESTYVRFLDAIQGTTPLHPVKLLQAPIRKGAKWRYNLYSETNEDSLTVISSDSTIEIQSVIYKHAIVMRNSIAWEKRTIVIVPGVGIVLDSIVYPLGAEIFELVDRNF